jgi:hypothetical protein
LAPMVVVGGLAAHIDHAVDGRAAAEHLAARIAERAPSEARLVLGLEAPIDARIAVRVEIAHRNMDPQIVVLAARFEQQHAVGRIGRQAVGEHAARRACTHDDIVEMPKFVFCRHVFVS